MEELELVAERPAFGLRVDEPFERVTNLLNVVVNELFGADAGDAVELGVADVAEVPVQALAQMVREPNRVALVTQLADLPQATANQAPVVLLAGLFEFPLGQTLDAVELGCRLAPALVVNGIQHGLLR